MFHIALVTLCANADAVRRKAAGRGLCVRNLSASAVFFQQRQAGVEHVAAFFPEPAVLQVILFHLRVVFKSVAIAVVLAPIVLKMYQQFRAEVLVAIDVHIAVGVGFELSHRVAIEVERNALLVLWFHVLNVYLSRHGFVAVLYRGVAFANLHALHPVAGNIA